MRCGIGMVFDVLGPLLGYYIILLGMRSQRGPLRGPFYTSDTTNKRPCECDGVSIRNVFAHQGAWKSKCLAKTFQEVLFECPQMMNGVLSQPVMA